MAGMEDVRAMIAQFGAIEGAEIADLRARYDAAGEAMPAPEGWTWEEASLGGRPARRWSGPGLSPGRFLLYLHGGGYCIGSPRSHGALAAQLGAAAGAEVFVLDYRLAPEHPHPAAVEDAVGAWAELLAEGRDPARGVLIGDSAGAGLAVAAAVAAKGKGVPQPGAIVALSPWANLAQEGFSYEECAKRDPIVTKAGLDANAAAYLAGLHPKTPLASPIFADLSGLAPMLIQVGAHEVLLADAEALKTAARRAGVDVTLEVWPEMIHVWHFFHAMLEEAREAIAEIGEWLGRRLPAA